MRIIIALILICGLTYLITYNYSKSHYPTTNVKYVEKDILEENSKRGFCGNATTTDLDRFLKTNCSSCHHRQHFLVGPALNGSMQTYSPEWIIGFINNPDSLIKCKDKTYLKLKKKYGHFPHQIKLHIDKLTVELANELKSL